MFPANTHILIVDDSALMHSIVKKHLTAMGFSQFSTALDGKLGFAALEAAKQSGNPVGLILSDWHMPEMSGFQFLQAVRQSEAFKAIPFVLLTANTEPAATSEAIAAGVSAFLVKPVNPEVLKAELTAVWNRVATR
ncbi:MAG: hypothetical protein RJB38_1944 [Pseudomonadota bacterium]